MKEHLQPMMYTREAAPLEVNCNNLCGSRHECQGLLSGFPCTEICECHVVECCNSSPVNEEDDATGDEKDN